jgi:predicted RecA/RadA family phage recombinase
MKNYICEGEKIQVTAPSGGYVSGNGYLIGSKFCVAEISAIEGDTCVLKNEGVFELAKATGAITIGQRLFWDDTNKVITTVALANTLVGYAYLPAASADATCQVLVTDNSNLQCAAVAAFDATSLATMKASGDALIAAMKASGQMANA